MMEGNEVEMFDPEVAGIYINGLTVGQIKKLKAYYQSMTGDMDLLQLEKRTEHF